MFFLMEMSGGSRHRIILSNVVAALRAFLLVYG